MTENAEFETVIYQVAGRIATITLNRPEQLNTIVPPMPAEVQAAVHRAVRDPAVSVIVVRGAGRSFCAGYNFGGGFHHWDDQLSSDGQWDPIGTPYSRMWGCYLSGMWLYRLGLTKAKEYALTGKPLSGKEAAEAGLINQSVSFAELEPTVAELAQRLAAIPLSQLAAMKLVVNHAYENMGLASTQTLGPILDGLMRNTPDARRFIQLAEQDGVRAAITERDGPFGDYSQAPPELGPNPEHVITP
jgi:enoyl-CoA hydratase